MTGACDAARFSAVSGDAEASRRSHEDLMGETSLQAE